jgi:hypothetical protein
MHEKYVLLSYLEANRIQIPDINADSICDELLFKDICNFFNKLVFLIANYYFNKH